MVQSLNKEQCQLVDDIIHSLPSRVPFFISGKAGTGKSYVINCIQNFLLYQGIPFIVTASTGISSILVGGRTLHSAFAIFSHGEKYFSGVTANTIQGKAIGNCEVLFVDEVTMINKDIFNLIDKKLKEIRSQNLLTALLRCFAAS